MTTASTGRPWLRSGDVVGGVVSGVMSLPAALAYGVLVFGPLGGEAAALGALSGLVTLAALNLLSAWSAGAAAIVTSPSSLPTLALASAVVASTADGLAPEVVVAVITSAGVLAGLLQLGIGWSGLGQVVKYIPFPVRAGLLTGIAVLMVQSQTEALFGAPLAPVVATATVAIAALARGRIPVPAPLLALVGGTALHHLLAIVADAAALGPTLGRPPRWRLTPLTVDTTLDVLGAGGLAGLAATVVLLAVTLAVVSSMETLVAILTVDNATGQRSDASRELVAEGAANAVTVALGGIVGAASPSRSLANVAGGGRTPRSRVVVGLFAVLCLAIAAPLLPLLPLSVLAGLLVGLAIDLVDPWLLRTTTIVARRGGARSASAIELANAVLVVLTTVRFGVVAAVAVGAGLSMLHFVTHMGMRGIRDEYDGAGLHSNIQRMPDDFVLLEQHGARILVIELQGSLFFATADGLAKRIDERLDDQDLHTVVLDMRRVGSLDTTGGQILLVAASRCEEHGVTMLLVARPDTDVAADLTGQGVTAALGPSRVQPTINDALGLAEDRLLAELNGQSASVEVALGQFPALAALDRHQLQELRTHMVERSYDRGETVFAAHDDSRRLHLLAMGRVDVIADDRNGRPHRITSLGPGTLIGEMALVDARSRSGSAVAAGDVRCFELDHEQFEALRRDQPPVALALIEGIALELATRLRIANRTVR